MNTQTQRTDDNSDTPMTMSASSTTPAGPLARLSAVSLAAWAVLAGAGRAVKHRFGGRPEPILNTGGRGDGPPDLDELWRDFNRKLSGLFGGKGGGQRPNGPSGNGGPSFQP